jgi:dihydropyrimidinase
MPLLFSAALEGRHLDLNRFVAVAATNPAKIYGLFPRKGTIAVGSDGDFAIWDPDKTVTISISRLNDGMDYTPYEGIEVTGWPELTVSRGEIIWRDGEFTGAPGRGRFLPCERPHPAKESDLLDDTGVAKE